MQTFVRSAANDAKEPEAVTPIIASNRRTGTADRLELLLEEPVAAVPILSIFGTDGGTIAGNHGSDAPTQGQCPEMAS